MNTNVDRDLKLAKDKARFVIMTAVGEPDDNILKKEALELAMVVNLLTMHIEIFQSDQLAKWADE